MQIQMERMYTSEVQVEDGMLPEAVAEVVRLCYGDNLSPSTPEDYYLTASPVSRRWASVRVNGFIFACIEPISTTKQQVSLDQTCLTSMNSRPKDYVDVVCFQEIYGVWG